MSNNVVHFVTGGAPSAPPGGGGESVPPPYSGSGGYGAVVAQQPYGAVVTQQPYVPPYGGYAQVTVKPPNYMALNAFAAFCCCLLCGLMGLYMGSQVSAVFMQAYSHSMPFYNNFRLHVTYLKVTYFQVDLLAMFRFAGIKINVC